MVRVKDRYQGVSLQRPLGKAPTRFEVLTLSFQLASCTPLFKDSPSIPPFITGDDHRLGPILYPVGDPPFLLAASKANRLPRRRSTTKPSHPVQPRVAETKWVPDPIRLRPMRPVKRVVTLKVSTS